MKVKISCLLLIVILAIFLCGAVSAANTNNNQTVTNHHKSVSTKVSLNLYQGTRIAYYNYGTTWIHFNKVFENVKFKNGTIQNIYAEGYLKPLNGKVVLDLSSIAGYGNYRLPPSTYIKVRSWNDLQKPIAGGGNIIQEGTQGWSDTFFPTTDDVKYSMFYSKMPVKQLPSNIYTNTVKTGTVKYPYNEQLYSEEQLFIDSNGKVTLNVVYAPYLIPPKVISTDPVKNAVNVPATKMIVVKFREPILRGINNSGIILKSSSNIKVNITNSVVNNVLIIKHSAYLIRGVKYSLIIPKNAISDLAGNDLVTSYMTSFKIETTPPKIIQTSPSNWKMGVSRTSTIAIKFSENIKASIYYSIIKVKNLATNKYVYISKNISGNTLKIKTSTTRSKYTWYTVTIPRAAIKDYAGNKLAATYTFKFKTGK